VIGAPRSGTTLLYKLLCLHPDTAWISNYLRRLPQAPVLGAASRVGTALPAARRSAWFGDGQAYRYGNKRSLSERAFPSPVEGEPFFARCGLTADGSQSTVSRTEQQRRLRRNVRSLCRAHGNDVFVSKRIAHNQRLPLLAQAFPMARFVHLVRDGRRVAASLRSVDWWSGSHMSWYGGSPTEWEQDGRDPWLAAALHWTHELQDIHAGLRTVDPNQVLELRYEDLLAKPVEGITTVCNFARLSTTREMTDQARTLQATTTPLPLDSAVLASVTDVQRSALDQYGYGAMA